MTLAFFCSEAFVFLLSLYSSASRSVGFAGLVAMMSVSDEADVLCSSASSYRLKIGHKILSD